MHLQSWFVRGDAVRWMAAMLLCVPCFALAQTAEAPEWKVGDKWKFHEKSRPPEKESDWSREVVATLPDGNLSVEMESTRKLEFDSSGNSLDRRGQDFSWQRFKFPLSVGANWSHARKIAGDTWSGDEKSTWKVLAYEKITVPAGTFDCFKVEGDAFRSWAGGAAINNSYKRAHTRTTYWYCPAIKWAAKWEIEDQPNPASPPSLSTSELVSFESKP